MAHEQPLTWYKTTFNAPGGDEPLALDMGSMGKGQIWINGQHIGRYWPSRKASGTYGACNYAGFFSETKYLHSCGEASQRWGNLMIIFEEWGGNPNGILPPSNLLALEHQRELVEASMREVAMPTTHMMLLKRTASEKNHVL